jgi:signal transduction histidine kinase
MLGLLGEDLRDDAPDLADARDQVGRAAGQAARLTRLAGELLDLSRLDAGVPIREELVDLGELTRAVVAEFDRGGEIAVRLEPAGADPAWAVGDPDAVARVVRILLDNALRFAPSGTAVTVGLHRRNRHAEIAVRDQGPGIPEEDRERIFERFERGAQGQEGGGFGLGLAIGRELARRMDGDLRLGATGRPTCFVLELPMAREAAQPAHHGNRVAEAGSE